MQPDTRTLGVDEPTLLYLNQVVPFRPPQYGKWVQASGYFDGDGTVVVRVQKFTLEFGLQFADGYHLQLDRLKTFLSERKVYAGEITKHTYEEMYVLRVSEDKSVLRAARNMLPHSCKKAAELEAMVKYMQNKISGNQAISVFNRMVREGERIGKIRIVDLPYTYDEGIAVAHESHGIKLAKLTISDQEVIQSKRLAGERVVVLAKEYGVSERTIRKALGGGYGQTKHQLPTKASGGRRS